jgi:hypothetical protein
VSNDDPAVLKYRLERIEKAPRMWLLWIMAFTFANGVFIELGHKTTVLAGLVAPFLLHGSLPHFVGGAVIGGLARFSEFTPWLLYLAIGAYAIDAGLSTFMGLWAGLTMHIVVLVLIGVSLLGIFGMRAKVNSASSGGSPK